MLEDMGTLQLNQLRHRLQESFSPHIDMDDLQNHGEQERAASRLSRSLAAYVLSEQWQVEPEVACSAVTDCSGDNGLDLVFAQAAPAPRVMILQSKWSQEGKGSAGLDDMLKFKKGVDDLIHGRRENFSGPILAVWDEVAEQLLDPTVRIELLFAHSGSGSFADDVKNAIDPTVEDLNEHQPVATFQYLSQSALHQLLLGDNTTQIDLDVELSDYRI